MSEIFNRIQSVHSALNYHMDRHNVLTSNVVNVDTPGFRPKELVRHVEQSEDFPRLMKMKATDGQHFQNHTRGPNETIEAREERVVQPGGDDNAVSIEREMAKIAANHLRYETSTKIVRQQVGLLRYAASDAQSG